MKSSPRTTSPWPCDDPHVGVSKEFIREQIESLATDADRPSAPQTPEQWRRCLREILRGTDWEFGTWR